MTIEPENRGFRLSISNWQRDLATGACYTRELDTDLVIAVVYGVDVEGLPFLGVMSRQRPRKVEVSSAVRVDIGRREGLDGLWTLQFTLLDIHLSEVFVLMGESMCEAVADSSDESEALRRVYSLVAKWQSLLRGRAEVSPKVLRGLAAEVETIVEIVSLGGMSLPEVLSAWAGPYGAPHDFEFSLRASLEVKAVRRNASRVDISSPNQLDGGDLPLLLSTLQIDQLTEEAAARTPSARSLSRVLEQLEEEARTFPNGVRMLWDAMRELGLNTHMPDLERFFYVPGMRHWYQVGSGFPRVQLKDVPLGIEDLTFRLQLTAIVDFELSSDIAIDALSSIPTGGEHRAQ